MMDREALRIKIRSNLDALVEIASNAFLACAQEPTPVETRLLAWYSAGTPEKTDGLDDWFIQLRQETESRSRAVGYMVRTAVDSDFRTFNQIAKEAALLMMLFFRVKDEDPNNSGGSCQFVFDLHDGQLIDLVCVEPGERPIKTTQDISLLLDSVECEVDGPMPGA